MGKELGMPGRQLQTREKFTPQFQVYTGKIEATDDNMGSNRKNEPLETHASLLSNAAIMPSRNPEPYKIFKYPRELYT